MVFGKNVISKKLKFVPCKDVSQWDAELLTYNCAHPFQTTVFSEYCQRLGNTSHYIHIEYDGEKIGQCVILVNQENIATWFYGPVVRPNSSIKYDDVLTQLLHYTRKIGVIGVENIRTQISYEAPYDNRNMALYSEICETPFIDLKPPIETIYRSFAHSARKNIRKCRDAGVDVVITNDISKIDPYIEMLSSHRKRLGYPMPYFYPNHETMKLFLREYILMEIALASIKGIYLAGLGFVVFGNIVIEVGVGQSDAYFQMKMPAQDLIKAEAVERYRKLGVQYYDLSGVKKHPLTDKEENIRRFKLKFSKNIGEYATINRHIISPLKYVHAKLIQKFNQFLNKTLYTKR